MSAAGRVWQFVVDKNYSWRLQVLFLSQLVCAVLGDLAGIIPGRWYAPEWTTGMAVAGLVTAGVGLFFRLWGTSFLTYRILASEAPDGSKLVSAGPFRFCRNPLYLGSLLTMVGFGMMFGWVFAALFAGFHVLRYDWMIRQEERKLAAEQGGAYEEYCRHVGRWWPKTWSKGIWQGPVVSWEGVLTNGLFVGLVLGLVGWIATNRLWVFVAIELLGIPLVITSVLMKKRGRRYQGSVVPGGAMGRAVE